MLYRIFHASESGSGKVYLTWDEAVEAAQESGLQPQDPWTVAAIVVPDQLRLSDPSPDLLMVQVRHWMNAVGASHIFDTYWPGYSGTVFDQYTTWEDYIKDCSRGDDNWFRWLVSDFCLYCYEASDAKNLRSGM